MPEAHRPLLAFDYGRKRIGVASGNGLTRTASPLTTLTVQGDVPWPEIDALIRDWNPEVIVVGRPVEHADRDLLDHLESFIAEMSSRYGIDVVEVDESYSSVAAESLLREGRREGRLRRRVRREQIDQHAACLIAEQWMNRALD